MSLKDIKTGTQRLAESGETGVHAGIAALYASEADLRAYAERLEWERDGYKQSLTEISEACNCCGDRHDLAAIAAEALEQSNGA
ncbi:MAG: hypothetical protein JO253_04645 [Alphaproteobacteria bacterium]|nr:hypothetical protein [Alphaproteobacteria bacterium]